MNEASESPSLGEVLDDALMMSEVTKGLFKDRLALFVELERTRRQLEEATKENDAKRAAVNKALLDDFAEVGIQNISVEGLRLYVREDKFVNKCKEFDSDAICVLLEEEGLGYLVKPGYNATSLKAAIVEQVEAEIKPNEDFRIAVARVVSPRLREALNIGTIQKIVAVKA